MITRPVRRSQVERRDDAEKKLLEAGVKLVAERGLESLTLGDVGIAAGYSRGLPAHHFGSKQNFIAKLVQFIVEKFDSGTEMGEAHVGLAAIEALIRCSFEMSDDNSIFMRVLQIVLSDGRGKARLTDDMVHQRERMVATFESHIRLGIKTGEIRHDVDPRMVSLFLIGSICELLDLSLTDRQIDLESAGHELVRLTLHGLKAISK